MDIIKSYDMSKLINSSNDNKSIKKKQDIIKTCLKSNNEINKILTKNKNQIIDSIKIFSASHIQSEYKIMSSINLKFGISDDIFVYCKYIGYNETHGKTILYIGTDINYDVTFCDMNENFLNEMSCDDKIILSKICQTIDISSHEFIKLISLFFNEIDRYYKTKFDWFNDIVHNIKS